MPFSENMLEGSEWVKWELGFDVLGKWDLLHWGWDLTTGKAINNF